MSRTIDHIYLKLERAEKHIADLIVLVRRFDGSDPYEVLGYDDPDTGDWVVDLKLKRSIPPRVAVAAGDAIHCLRASLDYLAYGLVKPRSIKAKKNVFFPIVEHREDLKAKFTKIGLSSQEAIGLIERTKPYKRRGGQLWALHQLDITDKHRLLLTGCAALHSFRSAEYYAVRDLMLVGAGPRFDTPFKDGDEVLRVPKRLRSPPPEVYKDFKFTFTIALREPGVFKGKPIVESVQRLIDLVKGIIEPFGKLPRRLLS